MFLIKAILILILFLFFKYFFNLPVIIHCFLCFDRSSWIFCSAGHVPLSIMVPIKVVETGSWNILLVPYFASSVCLLSPLILYLPKLPFHMSEQSLDRCQITLAWPLYPLFQLDSLPYSFYFPVFFVTSRFPSLFILFLSAAIFQFSYCSWFYILLYYLFSLFSCLYHHVFCLNLSCKERLRTYDPI